ncbi:MAG: hypothetical protein JSV85_04575 [Candidatus Bathyarchaeota archaeon]|nr:MAG: hypothetical protein JSV85_04575 [Candidatus Bathyarchaeota archaeon]
MRQFKFLSPTGLPDSFDVKIQSEEPIVKIEESRGRISISYTFPGFYLSDNPREVEGKKIPFKQINIAKVGFLAHSGRPLLPSFGRYVQIPFNCDFKFTVKKGDSVQFDGVLVLPGQEMLTDSSKGEHVFEYDKKFYHKDKFYPSDLVELTGPFEIDGYTTLLIHVRPLQYNPAKKKLIGFGNISVTIDVTPRKGKPDENPFVDPELNREAYGNLFINPRRRVEERVETEPGKRVVLTPLGILRGPEFLIVYHNTFKNAAEKLAKWKNMRGLRTETVSIGVLGNTVSSIKTYIRKKRGSFFSRLRYVLLFGDVDMIEPETIPGGPWGSNVTDYYYSTKTDPTGSTDCVLPWLAIGRIPVRTEKEGMTVVNQIIAYEKNPPCDPEYYSRMCFAAYFQGIGTATRAYMKAMEEIREHITTLGFDVERVYVSQTADVQYYVDGTPVPQEVKDEIVDGGAATGKLISTTAEGQLITGHRNHGDASGWIHPSFNKNHLESITSEYPTVFYSINCLTGKYDLTAPTESFAEKILGMEGGAPSLIAATRVSHTWLNNDLMKGLFDAMWAGVLPTFPGSTASYPVKHNRLGDILNYGKAYLPVKMSGSTQ